MTRKKRDFTRDILPDPKYGDVVLAKVINRLMRDGKKAIAEKAIYGALDVIEKKTGENPIDFFHSCINKIKPVVEVRSRRVGGATYQVPTEVRSVRAQSLAIRWLVQCADKRSERTIGERLANELIDAHEDKGLTMKKREEVHKMAEANKAFAHFRW